MIINFNSVYCQETDVNKKDAEKAISNGADYELERAASFFAAAGVSLRFGKIYSVAVAPDDLTVQFQKNSPLFSSVSLGMIWNPFSSWYMITEPGSVDTTYERRQWGLSFALFLNAFQLTFSPNGARMPPCHVHLRSRAFCIVKFYSHNKNLIGSNPPQLSTKAYNRASLRLHLVPIRLLFLYAFVLKKYDYLYSKYLSSTPHHFNAITSLHSFGKPSTGV